MNQNEETLDRFYHGRILVYQPRKGYRFAVDAPLLAGFIHLYPDEWACELGTGSGIISLLLSIHFFGGIVAVEIQEKLAHLAKKNVQINNLEEKIFVVCADIMNFSSRRKFEVVFSNPPYFRRGQGRMSPTREKAIAKYEIKCDMMGITTKTSELLCSKGRAYFIYPVQRQEELARALERAGLKLNRLRYVYPAPNCSPRFLLTQCSFQAGELVEEPPLFLLDEKGEITPEAEKIYGGKGND